MSLPEEIRQSIGALAKIMSEQLSTKNAVTILDELLMNYCLQANYEQLEATIEPNFTIRAYVNEELSEQANATSHDAAKEAAALKLLNALISLGQMECTAQRQSHVTSTVQFHTAMVDSGPTSADFKCNKVEAGPQQNNYVGILQELCMRHKYQNPTYAMEQIVGMSHLPTFTISCCLKQYKVYGTAGNKKAAKKLAAMEMYKLLQNAGNLTEATTMRSHAACIAQSTIEIKQEPTAMQAQVEKVSVEDPKVIVSAIQKSLNDSSKPGIITLKIIGVEKDGNHMSALHQVCKEQGLSISVLTGGVGFSPGERRKKCIVQLYFGPQRTFAVCCGSGADEAAAQREAARSALEYLAMMARCTQLHFDSSSSTG